MISLIVLAAGKSTRMKENKLLLRVDGETLIEHVVKVARDSNVDEIVVVLGHEAATIKELLTTTGCKFVVNESYEKGQSESVKTGLSAISSSADAVMFLPADVAMIQSESINKVIEEYARSKNRIVIASHRRESGHPILLDRTLFSEILGIEEKTQGLKSVVNRHRSEIRYVEAGTDSVLVDIDTMEEFDKYFHSTA